MHQCLISPDRHYEITTRPFNGCFYDPRQRLDAFRVVLRYFFSLLFCFTEAFFFFFLSRACISFLSLVLLILIIPPNVSKYCFFFFFSVSFMGCYYDLTLFVHEYPFFISRWPISLHFHYFHNIHFKMTWTILD